MKNALITIIIIFILSLLGGGYYWYFYVKTSPTDTSSLNNSSKSGFSPFSRDGVASKPATNPVQNDTEASTTPETTETTPYRAPKLRQLSTMPVAGISASSTKSSSIVRYVDRGTGHIYEANDQSLDIKKISNTTLPKIYEAYSNKNGTAYIVRYLKDQTDTISNFYTELHGTGTSTTETPYELKGKYLSPDVNRIAVSPSGDKVFTWNIEGDSGVGYISAFDEKTKVKIANTPLTQVTIDWPEANNVVVNTKASAVSSGFIYSIDTKTAVMKKVLGGLRGLTGKMSKDLSQVIYSYSTKNSFATSIFNTKDGTNKEVIFKTLSEKCTWSALRKNEVYCAVPTEIPTAQYPDDWYKGDVSFVDQIWHLNTATGEVHLLGDLLTLSNKLIDATHLTLDPSENTLYFVNKGDLTLWALDLNQ